MNYFKNHFSTQFNQAGADGAVGGAGSAGATSAQGSSGTGGAGATGATGAPGTAGSLPPVDFREFMDPAGNFTKPGWAGEEAAGLEKRFTNFRTLAKSYVHLERMNSNPNKVTLPGENAPQEDIDAFYSKLGRPAKPEDYQLTVPDSLKEVLGGDQAFAQFKGEAFKHGLNAKQVEGLGKWYFGVQEQAIAKVQADQQAVVTAATDALKKDWGTNFDTNVQVAKRGAIAVGGEELVNDTVLANNPGFIRAMFKVGQMLGEKGNLPGASQQQTGGNLDDMIAAIRNDKSDPYNNAKDPKHMSRVAYVNSLYQQKYAGNP